MRTISYTLFSIFLLIGLVCGAYSYDGQSNINFVIEESKEPKYFVEFSVDFDTPLDLPPNITPGEFVVFIWPGLQPDGPGRNSERNCFLPINNGVLQPVLTYGDSCAPFKPQDTKQWWISGQYVNGPLRKNMCASPPNPPGFVAACPDYAHCHGGKFLTLMLGQEINTSMVYETTTKSWLQTIESGGETRTYSISLDYCLDNSEPPMLTRDPQLQNNAILSIETYGYNTPLTQSFENILLKINVGDDRDATCDNTLSMRETIPSSSCSSLNMISNESGILTCRVESCTICKPTTLNSKCPTSVPTSVPTLSEWGLITMVTVIGIVGFMVLRRRRQA